MSNNKFESVSSFVDQENIDEQLIDDMVTDQNLSDAWGRYHLIGDVIRGEAPAHVSMDLSDNIMAAISEEPTVLAPNKSEEPETFKAKVIQLFKPVSQVAIAASAAGVMILGVQQMNVAQNDPAQQNQVIQTIPLGGVAAPVSLNYQKDQELKERQAYIEQQRKIKALLSDHNQQVKLHSVATEPKPQEDDKRKEDSPK